MSSATISQTRLDLPPIAQTVPITFRYEVHFTTGLFAPHNPLLARVVAPQKEARPKKAIAVIDSGVIVQHPQLLEKLAVYGDRYSDRIKIAMPPVIVPGGEAAKNQPDLLETLHQTINEAGICRQSYILAIGGGAVLDLVGYAAATAHRGIRLIRIPTTVLAQNDSGVGVKNGINAFGKKNFLGSFAPPYAVLNDFDFLSTLDDRDWRSGIAEAVKVALIKDADFFEFIRDRAAALGHRDSIAMQELVYRCAQLHLDHIANSGDPFEFGSSRPLDFGHWAAHRLEHLSHYRLRHGEAVAIGIALDVTYSYLAGMLSYTAWQPIISTLKTLGFSLYVPELGESAAEEIESDRSLFRGLREFQEHLGGQLTIVLLEAIGRGVEVNEVDISRYRQAVAYLRET